MTHRIRDTSRSRRQFSRLGALTLPVLALTLGLLALPVAVQAQDVPVIKVASDPSFKPFAFMDPATQTMEGFDVDLINAVGNVAGYKVKIVPLDFSGIIPALQSGNVDAGASSITITDARKKVIDFSDPYYDSGMQILVRDTPAPIASIEELKGKTVAVLTGSTGYAFAQEQLGTNVNLVPYASYSTAILALISGDADAVVGDQPVLAYYSATAGKGKAITVGPLYHGEQYGIAFPKGSKWVAPTNAGLAKIVSNGTYAELYQKWFGKAPPKQLK